MQIKHQPVIISGGGSGMGAACAKYFKEKGAHVTILDINQNAIEHCKQTLQIEAIQCDVTQEASVENALQQAEDRFGIARICINCAGVVKGKRMVGKDGPMPLQEFTDVININLVGTFNLMRLVARRMQSSTVLGDSQERGVIINTASVAAFEGQIGQAAYSASKGGIVSMTLPVARELAAFGIRVMTIAPGLVDTPMFEKIPQEARDALIHNVPFPHRLAKPEEFAQLAAHIVTNEMLNGSVIRLDGALRMQAK